MGILGTGGLAIALGKAWAKAGYRLVVTGRNPDRVGDAAAQIGATAADPADFADMVDVIVVAIAWNGLSEALTLIGAPAGTTAGKTLIDCTNPVDFATGELTLDNGSAAETVARFAPGAHVVKALHLFAGASWPHVGPEDAAPVVAICGDDSAALAATATLVAALGAEVATVGPLRNARQLEEVAGFVMTVVASGFNPQRAVPLVDPALLA